MMKSEVEVQGNMKAEEEDQIAEEARLKAEYHKRTRPKVEEDEVLLALELR